MLRTARSHRRRRSEAASLNRLQNLAAASHACLRLLNQRMLIFNIFIFLSYVGRITPVFEAFKSAYVKKKIKHIICVFIHSYIHIYIMCIKFKTLSIYFWLCLFVVFLFHYNYE